MPALSYKLMLTASIGVPLLSNIRPLIFVVCPNTWVVKPKKSKQLIIANRMGINFI
jgi:hypothetical protein